MAKKTIRRKEPTSSSQTHGPVDNSEAKALRAENAKLRRRLVETERHRQLLIETLHGLSKQPGVARSLAVGAPEAAAIVSKASPQTLAKLRNIISSYGIVPDPTNSTIVGPSIASMGQFTLDVNDEFARSYTLGQLLPAWTVNQTGVFVDNNP